MRDIPGQRSEEQVLRLWGIDPKAVDHCEGCHFDFDEGYSMNAAKAPDGEWEEVCCGASTVITKKAEVTDGE